MCHALYLGSKKKLQTSEWIQDETYFCLNDEENTNIKEKLNFEYIYYCCSYQGCSCGFHYDLNDVIDDEDKVENEWGKKSLLELFNFLKDNIKNNEIHLYHCWEGDELDPCELNNEINLSTFTLDNEFEFNDNSLTIIKE